MHWESSPEKIPFYFEVLAECRPQVANNNRNQPNKAGLLKSSSQLIFNTISCPIMENCCPQQGTVMVNPCPLHSCLAIRY